MRSQSHSKYARVVHRCLLIALFYAVLPACESISGYLWYVSLKPDTAFDSSAAAPAPDYADILNWAAHPSLKDNADVRLDGSQFRVNTHMESQTEQTKVDVFYIHPTTYYISDHWNQPLGDQAANDLTDNWVLLNQASLFSDCCSIYAPRYRQATLYAVISDEPDGDKALALAYGDVKAAFDYYLQHVNQGRPFIVASHSQGSWHALQLTEETIIGTPMQEKLVAGYLIGMPLPMDKFSRSLKTLSVCEREDQFQCILTWNAVTESADTRFYHEHARVWFDGDYEANEGKDLLCVNPLTWSVDSNSAPASLNRGGVNFKQDSLQRPKPDVGVVGARCDNGMLYITSPKTPNYDWFLFGEGNYHMHDYDLFYLNIQENVQARIDAYFEDKKRITSDQS